MSYLIVSYHTPDELYTTQAARLKISLDKFNLPYEIDCVPSLGSYQRNVCFKAKYIQKKLFLNPGKDIVWLDADSEIVDHPLLFNNIEADIAATLWDDKHLLAATLYFANNQKVFNLIDQWIETMRYSKWTRTPDQDTLVKVLAESPNILYQQLPHSYAFVPNESPDGVRPIIKQYLVSRTLNGENVYGLISQSYEGINYHAN